MTEPVLLTPREAAAALGIGRSKLYELLQTGVLESVHIGACRRIPTEAVLTLVARLRGSVADRRTGLISSFAPVHREAWADGSEGQGRRRQAWWLMVLRGAGYRPGREREPTEVGRRLPDRVGRKGRSGRGPRRSSARGVRGPVVDDGRRLPARVAGDVPGGGEADHVRGLPTQRGALRHPEDRQPAAAGAPAGDDQQALPGPARSRRSAGRTAVAADRGRDPPDAEEGVQRRRARRAAAHQQPGRPGDSAESTRGGASRPLDYRAAAHVPRRRGRPPDRRLLPARRLHRRAPRRAHPHALGRPGPGRGRAHHHRVRRHHRCCPGGGHHQGRPLAGRQPGRRHGRGDARAPEGAARRAAGCTHLVAGR